MAGIGDLLENLARTGVFGMPALLWQAKEDVSDAQDSSNPGSFLVIGLVAVVLLIFVFMLVRRSK